MLIPRLVVWVVLMFSFADWSYSESYPNNPIRIVTAAAGGGVDFVARLIAPGISGSLGEQVIVDNRGGAGGIIAIETVARAPPDGYTLLLYSNGMWILPFLRKNVPYDPVRDFSPIILAVRSPNLIVVHPSLPVNSVKQLIALAKANPGALNYGTSGVGSANHLAGELFKAMAGVNVVHIAYRANITALTDLIAGQLQLAFPTAPAVAPYIRSGKLRALAVASTKPSALVPDLPTVAASGLPGYESEVTLAAFAPAKTSEAIVSRLNQEIGRFLSGADVKARLFNIGTEVAGSSPEQLSATMKSEMARMGKVIKDAGIHDE